MPKKSTHPEHEEDIYPHAEQGMSPRKAPEERRQAINQGEQSAEPYDDEGLESLRDDDEIEDWEEGFMRGARGKGQMATCAHCDLVLQSKSKTIERTFQGELMTFCSASCASKGPT